MYKPGSLRVFDYNDIDIDENARIPTHIADKRLSAVYHTDCEYTPPNFSCINEWEKRKTEIKSHILVAAGLIPMPEKCPLNARVFDKTEHGDFTIEKVIFESYEGFFVTGNLYRPMSAEGKCPAILNAHGHWDDGRLERSEYTDIPGRCANFAKLGFIAFSYDMIGYNDSMQISHYYGGASKELWGMGGMGIQLWNSIRAVDFLESLEDVDTEKIICTGASGGASQVLFLAAVDERVKAVAAVNMVSARFQGGCCCENAALLRVGISNMDIAATIAPRPLLLTGSDGDWTLNLPSAEYPAIHSIYALYKQESKVEYFYQSAPHNYNQKTREHVYSWLSRLFFNDCAQKPEQPIALDLDTLRIFKKGEIPLLDLFEKLKNDRQSQFQALWTESEKETAKLLEPAMDVIFGKTDKNPAVIFSRETHDDGCITRYEIIGGNDGAQIPIVIISKGADKYDKIITVFHIKGKAAAITALADNGRLEKLLQSGYTVVSADLFLTGEYTRPGVAAGRNYSEAAYFTTFNRTDDAYKVSDVCLTLNYLQSSYGGLDSVIALGGAELHVLSGLAAGSYSGLKVCTASESFCRNNDWYLENFFVPGFMGIGGVKSILNICKLNSNTLYDNLIFAEINKNLEGE